MHLPLAVADPGEGPLPLFLDQTEAQRAKNIFLDTTPPPVTFSKGLDDRAPSPLSHGLDVALPSDYPC